MALFDDIWEQLFPEQPNRPPVAINQQYGNVLLEHVQINRQPSFLKVQVNIYADHLYTEARSFDDLVACLFSEA
jgi:hypothetical protein